MFNATSGWYRITSTQVLVLKFKVRTWRQRSTRLNRSCASLGLESAWARRVAGNTRRGKHDGAGCCAADAAFATIHRACRATTSYRFLLCDWFDCPPLLPRRVEPEFSELRLLVCRCSRFPPSSSSCSSVSRPVAFRWPWFSCRFDGIVMAVSTLQATAVIAPATGSSWGRQDCNLQAAGNSRQVLNFRRTTPSQYTEMGHAITRS
jgi:hypothetical protein